MKRRQALLLAAAALPCTALAAPAPAPDSVFEPSFGDLPEELSHLAERKKRVLLLFFEMEACPFCHRLHRNVLSQASVRAMLQRDFLSIRIDVQGLNPITAVDGRQITESALAKEMKVRGTPSIVAIDPQGRELARLVGAPASPEEFLLFGRYLLSGRTAAQSFAQYKQEQRAQP